MTCPSSCWSFERNQDQTLLLSSNVILGTVLLWQGELVDARHYMEHALTFYDPQAHRGLSRESAALFGIEYYAQSAPWSESNFRPEGLSVCKPRVERTRHCRASAALGMVVHGFYVNVAPCAVLRERNAVLGAISRKNV